MQNEESPDHCNQNKNAVDSGVQEIAIMDKNGSPHEKLSQELYGSKLADYSMSGYDKNSVMKESDAFQLNNQRITRKLLFNF